MLDEYVSRDTIAQVFLLNPADIKVGQRLRGISDREAFVKLKNSIAVLGVKVPISVRRIGDDWHLVVGQNRLDACRELGIANIPAREETGSDDDARIWEIAENLHRIELTVLERAHHEAEWARLFQLGTRAAARDLGVPVTAVHRSLKIDSLSWEAKAAAITHELDDNQSALEEAAEKTTWEEQVEVLKRRAEKAEAAKRARASKPRKPNPETAPQPEPTPESDEPADDVESKPTCATAKQRPMPEHLRPICTALWKLKKRDRSYIWYFLISNWRRDRAPEPQRNRSPSTSERLLPIIRRRRNLPKISTDTAKRSRCAPGMWSGLNSYMRPVPERKTWLLRVAQPQQLGNDWRC